MKISKIEKVILDTPKQYYDVINANPYNNFFVKTNNSYIVSHNCFFDEVSWQQNQDVAKQKEKAKALINTASARMQSRFMKGEKNPTLLALASSKRTEQSYMETFIESKRKQDSKTTLVVDEPQWVIRTDKDSERKFKVAIGNKFLSSEVVPLGASDAELKYLINRGYKLIDVPMGYYESFMEDIDIALTDIAGISTTSSNKYISGQRIAEVKTDKYKNAFRKEVIEVGNAKDDIAQYYDFFDLSLISAELKSRPLYVHLDMSVDGDKTGIGGVWIKGKRPPTENHPIANDLFYTLAFSVSVKAPKGHQISFEKNRNFIYWLREQGFNVKAITTDTFQSVDTGQQLASRGFNYAVVSVDRVDADGICKPWQYFRSTLYEQRMEMYENTLLTDELIGLERDNNSGKIDHSTSGINCFTGDTKVQLTDGRALCFTNLVKEFNDGKINYVYSFNPTTQTIESRPITNAWCSGHNASLMEVVLDRGKKIRCTPEHKFMLRSGAYCMAKDLAENDLLMPLCVRYAEKELRGYKKTLYNLHKRRVVYTRHLAETEDVYDITVEHNHNFALEAGIFVHNSKDQADAICGAIWRASQDADQFAFDYGEDLQVTTEVNLSKGTLDRKQINVEFEEELKNLLDPMARDNARLIKEIQQRNQQRALQQQPYGINPMYINDGIMVW